MEKNSKAQKELRTSLFKQQYDAVIDVYSKVGSARISKATKAKKRIGYKKWYTQPIYTDVYSYHYTPYTEAGLAIENRMKLLQAIDQEFPKVLKPKLYVTKTEITVAKKLLDPYRRDSEQKLFMIGILGSALNKTYPLPYLANILDSIVSKTGAQLLFNYIPKQIDQVEKLFSFCSEKTQKHILKNVYGKSLREFIALTTQCDALIGNEGGAINMAKALDIPTFAIFSPWIRRAAWALYENEQNCVVHLQDYKSNLYKTKSLKDIKKRQQYYYSLLQPTLFQDKLNLFLDRI